MNITLQHLRITEFVSGGCISHPEYWTFQTRKQQRRHGKARHGKAALGTPKSPPVTCIRCCVFAVLSRAVRTMQEAKHSPCATVTSISLGNLGSGFPQPGDVKPKPEKAQPLTLQSLPPRHHLLETTPRRAGQRREQRTIGRPTPL